MTAKQKLAIGGNSDPSFIYRQRWVGGVESHLCADLGLQSVVGIAQLPMLSQELLIEIGPSVVAVLQKRELVCNVKSV